MTVADWISVLERLAPPSLAESWDNVGLLVGDRQAPAERVLTCLTLTPDVVEDAIAERAQLIVTHHPLLFRPVQRITADSTEGASLLRLIRHDIAVYSSHTAYDSAAEGINQSLAFNLGLSDIRPIRPAMPNTSNSASLSAVGSGRWGRLRNPIPLAELVSQVGSLLNARGVQFVGEADQLVQTIGVACGSAASLLPDAIAHGCDAFLTGEARFHDCLSARAAGVSLVLPGHYATERPAVEALAARLSGELPSATVWASRVECDPVEWRLA
jgi:dinuclear metal center YbgI/SA1388 family protein